jgi:hypothetical protein
MGVEHLKNKRTGRPPGAKSKSAVKRDMMRAYRALRKPDGKPLPPGAAWWLDFARAQPEKFADCLMKAEILGPEKPSSPSERESDAAAGPAVEHQKTESGGSQESPPTTTLSQQNGNSPTREKPQSPAAEPTTPPVVRAGQPPQKVMGLFVPASYLEKVFRSYRRSVPSESRVVGCAMDKKENGILFTLSSPSFQAIAPGEPIPELRPEFSSGR